MPRLDPRPADPTDLPANYRSKMRHRSAVTANIADDPGLHERIRGIIVSKIPSCTATERDLAAVVSIVDLARVVAANPTVQTTVSTALDAATDPAPDVASAVATITDSDLEYVLVGELTFLS